MLREENQLAHRGRAKPPTLHRPDELVATGPNQVWCWDITYLPAAIRGRFYYCYTIVDVFSRKVVGRVVHATESDLHAAVLIAAACAVEGVQRDQLVIHSDNGGPMKGATMLATMQKLGVATSFSRPGVSDDNPFIEALFRVMKYCPEYPSQPFPSLAAARAWVQQFFNWYNHQHLHSSIGYVTPGQRHRGADVAILQRRTAVYEAARHRKPERWSRSCRSSARVSSVSLNPRKSARDETVA